MSTVQETRIPGTTTVSRAANLERLLRVWRSEYCRMQYVEARYSTTVDVHRSDSLRESMYKVVADYIRNAAALFGSKGNAENVSLTTLSDATSGVPFLMEDAFCTLLSPAL